MEASRGLGSFGLRVVLMTGLAATVPLKAEAAPVDQIIAAVSAVRSASRTCKIKALGPLKDARDILERSPKSSRATTVARRKVEDALDSDACRGAAQQAIENALKALTGAKDAAQDAAKQRENAAQERSAATAAEMARKRACWNYRNDWTAIDPGCLKAKSGNYPIDKAVFRTLLGALKNGGDRFERAEVFSRKIGNKRRVYVTSRQLALLLGALLHPIDRLEAVKQVARRIVDPNDRASLLQKFSDARLRREANDTLAELSR